MALDTSRVLVGLDFGTTFSGFAFAHRADPQDVQLFVNWPDANRPYCKTLTALFYNAERQLQDWGWTALKKYTEALQSFTWSKQNSPTPEDVLKQAGYFFSGFKLELADTDAKEELPDGFTSEMLIVDYLRCMSEFIFNHLRDKYGIGLNKREVQWCITVPAIWSQKSKHRMEKYAQKAGLVQGLQCRNNEASAFPLKIILEPEAASFSCQKQLNSCMALGKGDKFVVADIGGGTIDVVVHEKATDDQGRVHEVSASSGDVGGGNFVDTNFVEFLKKKIGCFEAAEPAVFHKVLSWWHGPLGKFTFTGDESKLLEVPRKLSKEWKAYDKLHGCAKDGGFYEEVEIREQDMRAIFDTEVEKAAGLIRKKLSPEIKYVFLVGGFAENQYLIRRMKAEFKNVVKDVISVPNAGAAVCRGAVAVGYETGVVLSRISKRWYGMKVSRSLEESDPPDYKYVDELGAEYCHNCFDVFVKKGESVPLEHSVSRLYFPSTKWQGCVELNLFCSDSDSAPRYTTDDGCEQLDHYRLNIKEDFDMGRRRSLLVSMFFGRAVVEVVAQRVNFGSNRSLQKLYSVGFDQTTQ